MDGEAVDLGGRAVAGLPRTERDVGARAAHVEGDDLLMTGGPGDGQRPEDAARGPARHHRDGPLAGRGGVGQAPSRVHHPQSPRSLVDAAEIAPHRRLEEGVHGRRAGAFVLAVLGQDFVGGAHGEPRLAERPCQEGLVLGTQVGEEQADGDRLCVEAAGVVHDASDLGVVERDDDLPACPDPLPHGDDVAPGDDVGCAARLEVVEGWALLPPDREQVVEPLGGDEDGARPAAFEQGVRGDGAAVGERALREAIRAFQHCPLGRGWRREAFPGADAASVDRDEIGERATHVHAEDAVLRPGHARRTP